LKILPNTAFVLFSSGAFGGAERRFANLFLHLNSVYPGKFCFIINHKLYQQLKRVFADLPEDGIIVTGEPPRVAEISKAESNIGYSLPPDPLELDSSTSFPRKVYWYYKNKMRQKKLFKEIERLKTEMNLGAVVGVFSGILPLVFYMNRAGKKPAVIFSNMDSWFSEVHFDMKKLWYRKYYSFNYAMENADMVDFLSPFVAEGVKQRNVNIPQDKISVAPSSFADYSKCRVGKKEKFEIAFSSRLEPGKNPMLFLESAEEILKSHPEIKFHVLGDGTLAEEVRNFINDRKLEKNITFRFHPNPPDIFAETSVFVSLQSGTNYPSQSILEAMACGNAIIASSRGDTGMFINSTNGILVELNKDSVVSAMKRLIEDPAFTRKLGNSAVKTATENHTIEKMTEYYIGLIKKVSAERNG
jgi:glycosyltransferase involved in cell wall biosynthesis